jgi:anti-sigma factor RsiW
MNCDRVNDLMAEYLGGELSGGADGSRLPDAAAFESHLDQCPSCAARVRGLIATRKILERLTDPPAVAKPSSPATVNVSSPSFLFSRLARPALKYAAIAAVAFALGYAAKPAAKPAARPAARPDAQHAGLAGSNDQSSNSATSIGLPNRLSQVSSAMPHGSRLAWGLLSLARE